MSNAVLNCSHNLLSVSQRQVQLISFWVTKCEQWFTATTPHRKTDIYPYIKRQTYMPQHIPRLGKELKIQFLLNKYPLCTESWELFELWSNKQRASWMAKQVKALALQDQGPEFDSQNPLQRGKERTDYKVVIWPSNACQDIHMPAFKHTSHAHTGSCNPKPVADAGCVTQLLCTFDLESLTEPEVHWRW